MLSLYQWFSNFSLHQNQPRSLLKYTFLGLTSRVLIQWSLMVLKTLYLWQFLKWLWCCWSGDNTLGEIFQSGETANAITLRLEFAWYVVSKEQWRGLFSWNRLSKMGSSRWSRKGKRYLIQPWIIIRILAFTGKLKVTWFLF